MGSSAASSYRRHRSARVAAVVLVLTIAAGCGGDDDATDRGATAADAAVDTATAETTAGTTAGTPSDTSSDTTAAIATDVPEEIGDAIATLYLAVYDDVVSTLADRPEPAEATTRLSELKERYVVRFVELGRRREALDAAGRGTVDATVGSALTSLDEDTLAAYQAALDHYAAVPELSELIQSFNIIGQYAAFELLRRQEPDEAARLGID